MPKHTCEKYPVKLASSIILISFFSFMPLFAAEQTGAQNKGYLTSSSISEKKKSTVLVSEDPAVKTILPQEEKLNELQKEARIYREQGKKFQELGDIESAIIFYQKAIQLDPAYALSYNDIGILYEGKGWPDRAEESYLRAVTIDPSYVSTYTNLALLCESQRRFEEAAAYWKKRVELGDPDDPWTSKAAKRLEDIRISTTDRPFAEAREKEVVGLVKDVNYKKDLLRRSDKALAHEKFMKAKTCYKEGDFAQAIKEALDAQYLDPDNENIEEFIDKVQMRALSR
jgi:tetratricopeptide (TPR) repeat protein